MTTIYSAAKICPYEKQICDLTLEGLPVSPNITDRFATSKNTDELKYLWKSVRDNTGKMMREQYKTYVNLMNTAAKGNNYEDASEWWQSQYETDYFESQIDELWQQIKPLYDELHTYVRYKLINIYGKLKTLRR